MSSWVLYHSLIKLIMVSPVEYSVLWVLYNNSHYFCKAFSILKWQLRNLAGGWHKYIAKMALLVLQFRSSCSPLPIDRWTNTNGSRGNLQGKAAPLTPRSVMLIILSALLLRFHLSTYPLEAGELLLVPRASVSSRENTAPYIGNMEGNSLFHSCTSGSSGYVERHLCEWFLFH